MGRAEWMISSKLKRANRNAALMLFDFWSVVRPKFFLQQTKYKRRFSSLSSRYLLSNWVVVYRIKEVKNIRRSRCVAVLLDWTREFDWMCFQSNYPPFIYSCDGPSTTTTAHSDAFSYTTHRELQTWIAHAKCTYRWERLLRPSSATLTRHVKKSTRRNSFNQNICRGIHIVIY
jgi:hypothetical protein